MSGENSAVNSLALTVSHQDTFQIIVRYTLYCKKISYIIIPWSRFLHETL